MQLVEEDGVGLAEDLEPLGRHLAQTADGQTGTGERMAPHQGIRQTQLEPQPADFVLEQVAQRLDQLEAQLLGEPADIMVDLDRRGGPVGLAAAFDHVRIERALGQEACAGDRPGLVTKDLDEDVTDPPPLLLRVGHPFKASRNWSDASITRSSATRARAERLGDRRPLTEPQQTGIDEHADHPGPQRLGQKGRAHGRVDSSR